VIADDQVTRAQRSLHSRAQARLKYVRLTAAQCLDYL
jgi:hypothetical protein